MRDFLVLVALWFLGVVLVATMVTGLISIVGGIIATIVTNDPAWVWLSIGGLFVFCTCGAAAVYTWENGL